MAEPQYWVSDPDMPYCKIEINENDPLPVKSESLSFWLFRVVFVAVLGVMTSIMPSLLANSLGTNDSHKEERPKIVSSLNCNSTVSESAITCTTPLPTKGDLLIAEVITSNVINLQPPEGWSVIASKLTEEGVITTMQKIATDSNTFTFTSEQPTQWRIQVAEFTNGKLLPFHTPDNLGYNTGFASYGLLNRNEYDSGPAQQ